MIYTLIGMGLLFVAIGFIVTENNAKYLLSGYNTMSGEERKKVNIKEYIPYFKKFHIFLGVSFLVFGLALTYYLDEIAGGIFLTVYPILAYIYFIATSSKYSGGLGAKRNRIGVVVLGGTLIFVIGLLGYGFKENTLRYGPDIIELEGSYGETLNGSEIKSIELVDRLPKISLKTNGFAIGTVRKGYFRSENGEIIKLILNSDSKPYILFTKLNGQKIYFSAKKESNREIVEGMKKILPHIRYLP